LFRFDNSQKQSTIITAHFPQRRRINR